MDNMIRRKAYILGPHVGPSRALDDKVFIVSYFHVKVQQLHVSFISSLRKKIQILKAKPKERI